MKIHYRITTHQILAWYLGAPDSPVKQRVYQLWPGPLNRARRNTERGIPAHHDIPSWEVDVEHLDLPDEVVKQMQSYPGRAD